ncbi:MAG: alpha/beta fold hydrolase [Ilumatobacteraceae bacterium]
MPHSGASSCTTAPSRRRQYLTIDPLLSQRRLTLQRGDNFPPEVLAGITKPTLVVHGEDDKLIPIAAGEYFAEHLPNVEFDRFPNTGHWLMIEQAQPFADRVRSFMNAS